MQLWIAIVLIAVAGVGGGLWALRQRRQSTAAFATLNMSAFPRGDELSEQPSPETPRNQADPLKWSSRDLVDGVPNISIPQLPENRTLAVLEFEGPPGTVPVQQGEIIIGRHSDDDVRVRDIRVSRHHARLVANLDGFEIQNLTAERPEPNPMLVNGRSRERASIADGDVITLGGVSFTLRLASG